MFETIAPPRRPVVALAASILILGPALGACQREEDAPAPDPEPVTAPTTPVVAIAPAPTLDRAALLQAMDVAASAYAAGRDVGGATLVGRRFSIRQTFGCAGPTSSPLETTAGDGLAAWSWSDNRQSLKLTLSPADWTQSPLIADDAQGWEAVEGFWLPRPWLRTEGCPAIQDGVPAGGLTPPPSPQTVGLAAVFKEGGSRIGRRNGRAYDFIVRGGGDQPLVAPSQGYRLVLEGRMAAYADGRAIRCHADSPDHRPICIGAVQLDRVAFEDVEGRLLSEWRGG